MLTGLDVDALECCCVIATRVDAADASAGSDAGGYALTREGSAWTIVRGFGRLWVGSDACELVCVASVGANTAGLQRLWMG